MKIVLNKSFGEYSLSKEAYEYLGIKWDGLGFAYYDDRANPKLIECVEKLGERASRNGRGLQVVEVPDDVIPNDIDWEDAISNREGIETIHEKHRSW